MVGSFYVNINFNVSELNVPMYIFYVRNCQIIKLDSNCQEACSAGMLTTRIEAVCQRSYVYCVSLAW